MTDGVDELARYEAALVEELARGGEPREIVERLRARAFSPEIDAYLAGADLRAIEIASLLVARFRRSEAELAGEDDPD
jgi:hypothetical protein